MKQQEAEFIYAYFDTSFVKFDQVLFKLHPLERDHLQIKKLQ